jgi:peptide/nickel transport system permease protein
MTTRSNGEIRASKKYAKRSQFGELFHRLKRNKGAVVGLFVIGILLLLLISTLFISYEAVPRSNVSERLSPPSLKHPFGTDYMGRDLFVRTIYGTRYSFVIGFGASLISSLIGVTLGSIAGYYGRIVEDVIMRSSDVLASIPGMLLGMVIVTVLGASLPNLIIAVGVCAVTPFIRITRASIISIKNQWNMSKLRKSNWDVELRVLFTEFCRTGFLQSL